MEASESSVCEFGCEIENFRGEKDGTSPGLLLMLYLKMTPKSLSNVYCIIINIYIYTYILQLKKITELSNTMNFSFCPMNPSPVISTFCLEVIVRH